MKHWLFALFGCLLWLGSAQTPQPVVRAVLFYSPTCGHCEKVINQDLPPLFRKYGDQLEMVGIDVTRPEAQALYLAALQYFKLPVGGVPFLVVGEHYMMGSVDIPEQFPGLVESYLAQGGVDWPAIPGLVELIQTIHPTATPTPYLTPTAPVAAVTPASPESAQPGIVMDGPGQVGVGDKLARDPLGNGLAIVTLLGMAATVLLAVLRFARLDVSNQPLWQELGVPVLCMVGLGVAGYLAYVETAQVTAVCGPVGDCNTVQQSEYARLFGFLPIGILGLLGYIAILAAWLIGRLGRGPLSVYVGLAQLGMTAFGLAFSIYLTFLEPFVIGATSAWCLTTALLITALFWLSLKPGKRALLAI